MRVNGYTLELIGASVDLFSFVNGIVKMAGNNGLQLQEVGDFGAQNCLPALN